MNKKFLIVLLTVVLTACYVQAQQGSELRFHGSFVENFDKPTPVFFNLNLRQGNQAGEKYYSLSEGGVMLFRIDPGDPAGQEHGPKMESKELTHFGTYAARVKIPDVTKSQPNVGAIAGFYTYLMDNVHGLSRIGIEWHIANPKIIYLGAWTGANDNLMKVDKVINLSNGIIYRANQPETIRPLENYDGASQFYTYGFDWYPDRIVWWINHPATEAKIVLWDYTGPTSGNTGIPVSPTRYLFNFWHTNDWPVETNLKSIEKPLHPYELEIDWMSYTPFEDLNKAYQEQNK